MKEVIEYIIAGLIIVSFLPLYTIINETLYTPPARTVKPVILALYTETINRVILDLAGSSNLTPGIIDIHSLIVDDVGADVYRDYGYYFEMTSWGILNITVNGNQVDVYTCDKGNLSLLIVYSDLSSQVIVLENPSSYDVPKGVYIYSTSLPRSDILVVTSVLETGITKYIDYYLSDTLVPVYIANINGRLYLLNDLDNGGVSTSDYHGYQVVDVYMYYYTHRNYSVYRLLEYNYATYAYYVNCGYSWLDDCGSYYRYVERSYEEINYYGIYDGVISINGKNYEKLGLSSFEYVARYKEYSRRLNIWGGYCSCSDIYYGRCTDTWYVYSSSFISDSLSKYDISAPLYNTVLVLVKDSNNRLYVATNYHHTISVGDIVPSNWPTVTITYIVRVGMIDYQVTLTVWRRSM